MAHIVKTNILTPSIIIVSVFLILGLGFIIISSNEAVQDNVLNNRIDTVEKTIYDSRSISILPDTLFASESNLFNIVGKEIEPEEVYSIIKSNVGVIFPKGFHINQYDLEKRFLPKIHLYIVGKWILTKQNDTIVIMDVSDDEIESRDFYLLSVDQDSIKDAILLASVSKQYSQFNLGPILSKKMSNGHIVRSIPEESENKRELETYSINEKGFFVRVPGSSGNATINEDILSVR